MGETHEKGLRLVYIEDDEFHRRLATAKFKRDGYEVVAACSNVQEALDAITKQRETNGRIDAIISDVRDVDSAEWNVEDLMAICQARNIPVVVYTGAFWFKQPPKIRGVRIVRKPGFDKIYSAIEDAKQELENDAKEKQRITDRIKTLGLVLLDDEQDNLGELAPLLERQGFRSIVSVTSVKEAEDIMCRERIDIVITDILLGFDTPKDELEAFVKRCLSDGIAVVLLTGAVDNIPKQGIDGVVVLEKPCYVEQILKAIDEALDNAGKKRVNQQTAAAIHALANPEYHLSSPMIKWIERVLDNPDSTAVQKAEAMLTLEKTQLEKELREAGRQGEWPRKEMDELFDKYMETKARLLRLRSEKREHGERPVQRRANVLG